MKNYWKQSIDLFSGRSSFKWLPSPLQEHRAQRGNTLEAEFTRAKLIYDNELSIKSIQSVPSSVHPEHDLTLNVSQSGPFMRLSSVCKQKSAIYGNAKRSIIEQASDFSQLLTARANLSR
jgi:hypothetical protein